MSGKRPIFEEELVSFILESMGVVQFDPSVLPHLTEIMHEYTETILAETFDNAVHAGRKTSETSDIKLALTSRALTALKPAREVRMLVIC